MNKQYEIIDGVAVNQGIGWCTHAWNPLRYRVKEQHLFKRADGDTFIVPTGGVVNYCQKISPGCAHCYAERQGKRKRSPDFTIPNLELVEPFIDAAAIRDMLGMKVKGPYPEPHTRPAVFVGDMTDLWGDWVPFEMIDRVMAVAALRPDITLQFLTKRSARMVEYFESRRVWDWGLNVSDRLKMIRFPLPNVLLGFSAENQEYFDARWADMRKLAGIGWKVFASIEPQIGPVDCRQALPAPYTVNIATPGICWAIDGGESGRGARAFDIHWMRSLIEQFGISGLPLWCKQIGANPMYRSHGDNDPRHLFNGLQQLMNNGEKLKDSHGGDWSEWPHNLRVRQLPNMEEA